jgi:acetyl-CoA carboxylase biotin carboxyl carrier protein
VARGRRSAGRRPPDPAWSAEALVELAVKHDLAELEVEQGGSRIRVVREHAPAGSVIRADALPQSAAALPAERVPVQPPSDLITIEAPMVGTFYRSPSPTAAPFVGEGDLVKEGQVLCIIEAMKLLNEIEAKTAGRIVKVLVDNAQPVEYGQPLFLVDPRR